MVLDASFRVAGSEPLIGGVCCLCTLLQGDVWCVSGGRYGGGWTGSGSMETLGAWCGEQMAGAGTRGIRMPTARSALEAV